MDEQVVLITGGGTGLGKAMALECASRGANIVIAGRRQEVLDETAHLIAKSGSKVLTVKADVRNPEDVQHMVDTASDQFKRIDVLVNNAAGNFMCAAEKLSVNGWNAVIDIVLNGTFYCSSAAGKRMIAQGHGNIVNIIATYAWASEPGVIHSASAKAGVLAMTRTLAVEWARYGIRVNAIAPGAFRTEGTEKNLWGEAAQRERMSGRIPQRRFGEPNEVAHTLLFLLSDYSKYITGEVITVDGGGWLGKGTYEIADVQEFLK
ncbi:2,4-dienoyl-CoA reductase [bacterium]|nr:2,4-dienoyl-CoA reductase [bacterium]